MLSIINLPFMSCKEKTQDVRLCLENKNDDEKR